LSTLDPNIDPTLLEDPSALIDDITQPEEAAEPEVPAIEAAPAEEEKTYRIRLRDGEEITGKTKDELLQALAERHDQLKADSTTRTAQAQEVRGKLEYQQENKPREPWNDQKYLNLLGSDPMEARRYQDRYYYNLDDDEDPAEAFRQSYQVSDRILDTLAVTEFRRSLKDAEGNQIFPAEGDAEKILQQISKENLPLTPRNLTAMYHELVSQRKIAPGSRAEVTATSQYEDINYRQQAPRSRGATAPKGTGGGSATTTQRTKNYEAMSAEELRKEFERLSSVQ
jgi:hypothetical protein